MLYRNVCTMRNISERRKTQTLSLSNYICLQDKIQFLLLDSSVDVIMSLVSLEHGVYSWEKVTS
jgi:hypothetical protein